MSTPQTPAHRPGAAVGPAAVIVLAAGKGTRMKSKTPKILHRIGGRSMVGHCLVAARSLRPGRLAAVVRFVGHEICQHVPDVERKIAPDVGRSRRNRAALFTAQGE